MSKYIPSPFSPGTGPIKSVRKRRKVAKEKWATKK